MKYEPTTFYPTYQAWRRWYPASDWPRSGRRSWCCWWCTCPWVAVISSCWWWPTFLSPWVPRTAGGSPASGTAPESTSASPSPPCGLSAHLSTILCGLSTLIWNIMLIISSVTYILRIISLLIYNIVWIISSLIYGIVWIICYLQHCVQYLITS